MKSNPANPTTSPRNEGPPITARHSVLGLTIVVYIVSVLSLLAASLSAQQLTLDSLHRIVREQVHDTMRVNALNRISYLTRARGEEALASGTQALDLARRKGFQRGEANALLALSAVQRHLHSADSAERLAEQALLLSKTLDFEEGIIRAYIEICRVALKRGDAQRVSASQKLLADAEERLSASELLVQLLLVRGALSIHKLDRSAALRSFRKALRIAEVTGDTPAIAEAHLSLAQYFIEDDFRTAKQHLRYVLDLAGEMRDSLKLATSHNLLGRTFHREHLPDSARKHFEAVLALGEALALEELVESAIFNLGVIEARAGRLEAGLRAFLRGAKLARERNNMRLLQAALGNIAQLHLMQKQYDAAIGYLEEALVLCRAQKDTAAIAVTLDDIGMAYYEQGRYDSARAYLRRAVPLARRAGRRSLGWRLSNLGYIQYKAGLPDSAIRSFQQAVNIGRTLDDRAMIHNGQAGLARVLASVGRLKDARSAVDEAFVLAKEMNNPHALRNAAASLRMVCEEQGDYRGAYEAFITYTTMKDSLLHEENMRTISEMSAKYETEQRKKQIALLNKDREIKDLALARQKEELHVQTLEALKRKQQIDLLEKDKTIQTLEIERRDAIADRQNAVIEKREHEVRLLTKDRALATAKLARETFRRNTILAGLGALLVVTVLVLYRYREKQKDNARLLETLAELERRQDQLVHAEKMATLGELTAGIAHEIKNPLNFVMNFSMMSSEIVNELSGQLPILTAPLEGETTEVKELFDELYGNMTKIQEHGSRANNIIASMQLQTWNQRSEKQPTLANTLLHEAVSLAWHAVLGKRPDFFVHLVEEYDDALPEMDLFPQEISRVFFNLLTNAFEAVVNRAAQPGSDKYEPTVLVRTFSVTNGIEIRVRDNGVGIPVPIRDKIYQPFFTTKAAGEGTGLGLSLSYDIVVKGHSGSLLMESNPGEYAEFVVFLPHPRKSNA